MSSGDGYPLADKMQVTRKGQSEPRCPPKRPWRFKLDSIRQPRVRFCGKVKLKSEIPA